MSSEEKNIASFYDYTPSLQNSYMTTIYTPELEGNQKKWKTEQGIKSPIVRLMEGQEDIAILSEMMELMVAESEVSERVSCLYLRQQTK